MLKKILGLSLVGVIALTTVVSANSSGKEIPSFSVNGQVYTYDKYYERPYISEEGELMGSISITLRLADEGSAYFSSKNQSILMYKDGKQIKLYVGDTSVTVDEKVYEFDTPVTKKYGRVFLPIWVLKAIYDLDVQVQKN